LLELSSLFRPSALPPAGKTPPSGSYRTRITALFAPRGGGSGLPEVIDSDFSHRKRFARSCRVAPVRKRALRRSSATPESRVRQGGRACAFQRQLASSRQHGNSPPGSECSRRELQRRWVIRPPFDPGCAFLRRYCPASRPIQITINRPCSSGRIRSSRGQDFGWGTARH
jgi:hypothetical protein